ncbi:hypothetical protein ACGFYY_16435 [Streptomyces sp. NPDC048331]|uniref:hypothetical protein n=1 Tax=Streptomyces sp. NPDC048331 TaxID=3365534 RepID=UPI0037133AA4
MSHTSRTLRFALLTASTSLALGGALLPTGAFAAPAPAHAITLPAEDGSPGENIVGGNNRTGRDGHDGGWSWNRHRDEEHRDEDTPRDDSPDTTDPADSDSADTDTTDREDRLFTEEYCNDPKALPGVCVDGKPRPKGDNTVKVPQAPKLCLGVDTPEQCAARQNDELVPAPRPRPSIGLAV